MNLKLGSVTETESPGAQPGKVISQQFQPGEQLEVGKAVGITIAKAAQQTQVPNLAGKTVAQAKQELAARGLSFGRVSNGPTDDNAIVMLSDPIAGTPVNTGQVVNVFTQAGGQQDGGNNGNNAGSGFFGGLTGGTRR